jgi:penicillin amidase
MNKKIFGSILLLLTIAIIYLIGSGHFGIPPLGKQLSPTHGFWKNAQEKGPITSLKTPNGKVDIFYDEQAVPHLFAPNEKALYYAQGYIQAADRLWQMDFQTRVAGGTLSEAIGEEGKSIDQFFRRLGIPKAAKETYEELKSDTVSVNIAQSYADGVNAYIKKLKRADYPLEFKLANYAPEPWSVEKSILLLKLMAFRLAGSDSDVANTNTANLIGQQTFDLIFPDYPQDQSPIIPSEKIYDFEPLALAKDSVQMDTIIGNSSIPDSFFSESFPVLPNPLPYKKGIGSNNWAVGKTKTKDGSTILCNDPHLWLSFPSIWYQMQLHTPEMNVYGVTIPGAPGIVIGFNEKIAWGVTNSGRDIRNWYSIQYKDETQTEYLLGGKYYPVEKRIEHIKVKNGKDLIDTVRWTKIGPIVYDQNFGKLDDQKGLAMHWVALQTSNEMKTFYLLNKASNHDEYLAALEHFETPGQNFVFGDTEGNVAIKNQGKFPLLRPNQGKYVQALDKLNLEDLERYIPLDQNPHIYNPTRGFVSSANQNPTDATYPYYYSGNFEYYRNRRINQSLDSLKNITVEDMMQLQNDNYNLMAAEILPYLLSNFSAKSYTASQKAILDTLKQWNHYNEYYLTAPTYFKNWWTTLKSNLLDELQDSTQQLVIPTDYQTYQFIKNNPEHSLIDNKNTTKRETVATLIRDAFFEMTTYFKENPEVDAQWKNTNKSTIKHLMELDAFSKLSLEIGGSENSVNANNNDFGPSWRMIVKLDQNGVEAYGVYPGGQSGNPSSPHYDDFVEHWRTGQYYPLHFYKNKEEAIAASKTK